MELKWKDPLKIPLPISQLPAFANNVTLLYPPLIQLIMSPLNSLNDQFSTSRAQNVYRQVAVFENRVGPDCILRSDSLCAVPLFPGLLNLQNRRIEYFLASTTWRERAVMNRLIGRFMCCLWRLSIWANSSSLLPIERMRFALTVFVVNAFIIF